MDNLNGIQVDLTPEQKAEIDKLGSDMAPVVGWIARKPGGDFAMPVFGVPWSIANKVSSLLRFGTLKPPKEGSGQKPTDYGQRFEKMLRDAENDESAMRGGETR